MNEIVLKKMLNTLNALTEEHKTTGKIIRDMHKELTIQLRPVSAVANEEAYALILSTVNAYNSTTAQFKERTYGVSAALSNVGIVPFSYLQRKLSGHREFRLAKGANARNVKDCILTMLIRGLLQEVPKSELDQMYGYKGRALRLPTKQRGWNDEELTDDIVKGEIENKENNKDVPQWMAQPTNKEEERGRAPHPPYGIGESVVPPINIVGQNLNVNPVSTSINETSDITVDNDSNSTYIEHVDNSNIEVEIDDMIKKSLEDEKNGNVSEFPRSKRVVPGSNMEVSLTPSFEAAIDKVAVGTNDSNIFDTGETGPTIQIVQCSEKGLKLVQANNVKNPEQLEMDDAEAEETFPLRKLNVGMSFTINNEDIEKIQEKTLLLPNRKFAPVFSDDNKTCEIVRVG